MLMVGFLAAVIWGTGVAMGAPKRARRIMVGVLLAVIIASHLALPDGHPWREATGGDPRLWGLVIGLGVVVWGYTRLFRAVKARKAVPVADVQAKGLQNDDLDRYARHIMLREIGGTGQVALSQARVLVVGAGGLGSPVLLYLAAAGVGTLGVIDDDVVEASNLQRQVLFRDGDRGLPKVQAAAQAIAAINPRVAVRPYNRRLTADIAAELVADYDLVLDGCDSFETRDVVNAACVAAGVPLIAGALTQWEGQISLYHPAHGTPCYTCVFPNRPAPGLVPSCAEAGVLGPLPGVVGSMMAVEAVKVLTDAGTSLGGRLLIYDALYAQTRIVAVPVDATCRVCAGRGLQADATRAKVGATTDPGEPT
ncbi:Molybdopterin or thiamine biosynthesis adenylyltransferase [Loktanella fryxellensis]|uniref:Molybdopterin-synthase adenylyltransferase n=1 Tax=Loktanella fryxellensis TaxID=245187 RepID=A0A1H8D9N2_9RHOB|nr:HesA/MoeB/ThiF family protein [Loktanella fryxellensis]SEN03197.1 Molybdopterin or thiamine biosynthesis adenylyltransferase [Loktanella fryxellensis]